MTKTIPIRLSLSRAAALSCALVVTGMSVPAFGAAPDEPKFGAIEERDVTGGKVKLDPRAGYIFVTAPSRTFGTFLRMPDDATRADYQKDWEKAFAKAQKRYADALIQWERDVSVAAVAKSKPPARPEEPTRENFRIESIELRNQASFGPTYVFTKAPDRFAYLTAVKPGTYIYYGPVMVAAGAAAGGACACMGTVRIEVKAGTVTDLGNSLTVLPKAQPPFDVGTQAALALAAKRFAEGTQGAIPAPALAYGLPESLRDWPVMRAEFYAYGKVNNYYGLTVTRLAPIPGILGYRRDTVIDERTGAEVSSPTIYTQAKVKR